MRCVIRLVAVLGSLLVALQVDPVEARRIVLVIGNADYKVEPLQNPVNDAAAVAEVFAKELKFDKVILKKNLGAVAFRAALLDLSREVSGADVGAVYFAGHGTEVGGKNFLIPTDARLARAGDLNLEAILLDTVLDQLAGAGKLKLVILDACRNNPFPLAGGKRTVRRGFSAIDPEDNTLVVYAAKEGTTADDGPGGRHSPFTASLIRHIATPGLEINFVFRRVRDDVVAVTNREQQPHVYGSLGAKEFYLLPPLPVVPAPVAPAPSPPSEAARTWTAVKDTTSIPALEEFRRQYGNDNPVYDRLAEARIAELKKQQTALAVPPPAPRPEPPPAAVAPPNAAPAPGPGSPYKVLNPPPSAVPAPAASAFSPTRPAKPLTAGDERALKPKDSFRECDECPEMVVVPAGSFTIGSPESEEGRGSDEGPQHRVTIARPFAVGKFEVTFGEWDACVAAGGCKHRPDDQGWGRGKRPVINVSWDDITGEYLAWLSRKTGKTYRLLTEAEWEYAARAGTTTPYATGRTITKSQANFEASRTVDVGSFRPNAFGLYDMHGNVWEWVQDCWHGPYNGAPTDGSAWTRGYCVQRVLRGGAWNYNSQDLRSAYRSRNFATDRYSSFGGFRLARTLIDEAPARPAKTAPPPVSAPKKDTPPRQVPAQARPNALQYSRKYWPFGSIPMGKTESANTPYGRLTCTNAGPTSRLCSWQ